MTPVVHEIRPLPDFLADHTLAAERGPDQLREALGRWVDLVRSLHVWSDRVTFAIRFLADRGAIRAFFIAAPRAGEESPALRSEIEVLLRTHRILTDASAGTVPTAQFQELSTLKKPCWAAIAQKSMRGPWTQPARFRTGLRTGGSGMGAAGSQASQPSSRRPRHRPARPSAPVSPAAVRTPSA